MTASARQAPAPTDAAVHIRLVGTVSLTAGRTTVADDRFPGRQGRLLFARLATDRGLTVPRDELVELLWGASPPATWDKALTVLVSKLRTLLSEAGLDGATALSNVSGGYRLELPEPVSVDIDVAEQAVRAADAALVSGSHESAIVLAAEALAVLRLPFLPDCDALWANGIRRELADLADAALASAVDAQLAAKRPADAVRLAQEAVALQPFREAGHRRVMQAHAAAGNRAEALRVYDSCRRLLSEELGAYPSPETEALFQEFLREPPHTPAAAPPAAERLELPPKAWRRRTWRAAALLAVLVGAGSAAALMASRGGAHLTVGENNVASINPSSGQATAAASGRYSALDLGPLGLWAVEPSNGAVVHLDANDGGVRDTVPVGDAPAAVAVGAGSIWVANSGDGTVSRVSPERGAVVQAISVGNGPAALAIDGHALWVANRLDSTVVRVNPRDGSVVATIPIPSAPAAVEVAGGSVWVTGENSAAIFRIDPSTNAVAQTVSAGHGGGQLAAGSGALWVTNAGDRTVTRIDPSRGVVTATIELAGTPVAVGTSKRKVWVGRTRPDGIDEIDPAAGRVVARTALAGPPRALASGDERVWLSTGAAAHRGGTLRIVAAADPTPTLDPALIYDVADWGMMANVYDGLVGYSRAGGPAGIKLVPDLAAALPDATDGGRTYRFRLRRGIRYSDGSRVRAHDFARTIERLFRLRSPGAAYYGSVRGATACRPSACDLSGGIVTDDMRGTVVFRLVRPDPEFRTKLALPFAWVLPAATGVHDLGTRPAPGTGPYRIASFAPRREMVLTRNARFREWSAEAQPRGNPDRIVMRIVPTLEKAVTAGAIEHADIASGIPAPAAASQLLARYAARIQSHPQLATNFLSMNTRVRPFDDVRVRRAVNFAIDRRQLARDVGAPLLAQPACQALPPGLLGYRPYCPYTRGASNSAAWRAPDIPLARRLIRASGTEHRSVTIWTFPEFSAAARHIARSMQRIGLRARTKVVPVATMFDTVSDSRNRVQAATSGWGADYPAPGGFVFNIFDCASFVAGSKTNPNISQFCDPRAQAAMDRAVAAEASDLGRAGRLWQVADRRIVDAAPVATFANPRRIDVVSPRVRGYEYHPVWGALLDQITLR
jgi:peptide/nickel transport system substrate-binding protein